MTGPDYPHLERVVPGPDYPIRPRERSGMVVVWIAAVLVIVAFVLSVAAAASRGVPEHSHPQSPAEPAGGAGEVAQALLGAPPGTSRGEPTAGRTGSEPEPAEAERRNPAGGVPLTSGEASWYDDGPGLYGAVNAYRFGDDPYWVEVCRQDASGTCVLVLVRDHMANERRAIDLSPTAFHRLWPGLSRGSALDRGVVDVTVRTTGATATLPPTEATP